MDDLTGSSSKLQALITQVNQQLSAALGNNPAVLTSLGLTSI
jgi:hypothetical protein